MSRATLLAAAVLLGACVGSLGADDDKPPTTDSGVPPTTSGPVDLPCEVAAALGKCTSCHGSKPSGAAPFSLVTRADLVKPSPEFPAQSIAERCVERMKSVTAPMPPSPATRATAAEIAAFEAWIASGAPAGACGAADAGPSPFDTPVVCTSGQNWLRGDEGSPDMHPGKACLACHAKSVDAPRYLVAGTAYPSAHEPDDCLGKLGVTATVVITDAAGRVFNLPVTARGNFYLKEAPAFTPPYRAKIVYQGRERAMVAAQTNAECNACHTVAGADGAPGRIVLP